MSSGCSSLLVPSMQQFCFSKEWYTRIVVHMQLSTGITEECSSMQPSVNHITVARLGVLSSTPTHVFVCFSFPINLSFRKHKKQPQTNEDKKHANKKTKLAILSPAKINLQGKKQLSSGTSLETETILYDRSAASNFYFIPLQVCERMCMTCCPQLSLIGSAHPIRENQIKAPSNEIKPLDLLIPLHPSRPSQKRNEKTHRKVLHQSKGVQTSTGKKYYQAIHSCRAPPPNSTIFTEKGVWFS